MELFGILLSIPAAFVASSIYCGLLERFVSPSERLSRCLRLVSFAVLALFAVELVLVIWLGAVRCRAVLGPGFYVVHVFLFFATTPALANLLILRRERRSKWYVVATLCTVLAFITVLLQYGVSESLYGIDGEGGPYSSATYDR